MINLMNKIGFHIHIYIYIYVVICEYTFLAYKECDFFTLYTYGTLRLSIHTYIYIVNVSRFSTKGIDMSIFIDKSHFCREP